METVNNLPSSIPLICKPTNPNPTAISFLFLSGMHTLGQYLPALITPGPGRQQTTKGSHSISRAKHLHFLGEKLGVQVQISSPLFYASLRSSRRNLVYLCLILRGTLEEVCFPSNYKRNLGGELQWNSHLRQRM